ncbi:MAG: sialate O-acetylesterase [Eubacterium sp.]|nr:sialate O-acetylesterase [Eubacterium sp.]
MKKKILSIILVVILVVALLPITMGKTTKGEDTEKKPDPNFHIFIAFGQEDMEGQGEIEEQDKTVDPRFQMMCTSESYNGSRVVGKWNDAIPPLANTHGKLGVADYFGRSLIERIDPKITVGIINVSVAGSSIILFQEDVPDSYMNQQAYWFRNIVNDYGGNVYNRLIEMGKEAQKDGVIKGIIMHQGATDAGDADWPRKVKSVYNNIINDLNLGNDIPLLAGEAHRRGPHAGMNTNISKLLEQSKNFFTVSSEGLTDLDLNTRSFTSQGYREFGKRYAEKMMDVLDDKLDPVDTVASISKEPTANNRYDDGTKQPLLNNDGEAKGGTLYYGLGTQTQEPSTYSTDIPEKSEQGTYYVWVKAVGDSLHSDSEAKVYKSKIVFPITFKVVGGAWNDGTTKDKRVDYSRYDDEDLALVIKPEDIPSVGEKPDYGYLKGGSWDEVPPTDRIISSAKTYTYSYEKDPNPPTTVNPMAKMKKINTLSVKGKKVEVKYKRLKKKAKGIKAKKSIKFINRGQGKLSYKLLKVKKPKFKKYFKINRKTGKIKIKKKLKKGKYRLKVRIIAAGNENYIASAAKIVTVKIRVK